MFKKNYYFFYVFYVFEIKFNFFFIHTLDYICDESAHGNSLQVFKKNM